MPTKKPKAGGPPPDVKPADDARSGEKVSQRQTPKWVRWVDLLAALLRRNYPVTFRELRREVPAYAAGNKSAAAVEKMFERDKEELRAFGIPLETVPLEQDAGYRLRRRDFYLPYLRLTSESGVGSSTRARAANRRRPEHWFYSALQELAFEPDELAVVAAAAARVRALGDTALAALAASVMRKLAVDLPVDAGAPGDPHVIPPRTRASRKILDSLGYALLERRPVAITYRSMGRDEVAERLVEPWGLFFLSGHWYLAARDRARGEGRAGLRNFRVDRVREARAPSKAIPPTYDVPTDFRLAEHAVSREVWALGDGDAEDVVIAVAGRSGAALPALRVGQPEDAGADGTPRRRLRVKRRDAFLRWAAGFAGEVVPISPPAVVAAWREYLRATRVRYGDAGEPEHGTREAALPPSAPSACIATAEDAR